jgi:hypothetical protein
MTSYAEKFTSGNITAALAELIEAARHTPTLRCAACRPLEACSLHLAGQLIEAVREEELVLMPTAEADAIIHEAVRRLTGRPAPATNQVSEQQ